MRVLVVGGTGFIGPHVVARLHGMGHAVALFHRGRTEVDPPPGVGHIHGDRQRLGDHAAAFARVAPEVVLDMAPATERDAQTVLAAFRGIARRVVAVSSMDVYLAYDILRRKEPGPVEPAPIAEDAPLRRKLYPYRGSRLALPRNLDDRRRWRDDYDKILVERAVLGDPELPGTILRLPMVHGPGDGQHRLWPYLRRMDDGRPAIVLDEGLARWRGARGYVENVADAIALAVADERAAGRVYNVGEAGAVPEAEWVRRIARAAGWQGEIVALPRDRLPAHLATEMNTDQHWIVDSTRIRRELGYAEPVPADEGLRRAVVWERAHPPERVDPAQFDYAAEDAALAASARRDG